MKKSSENIQENRVKKLSMRKPRDSAASVGKTFSRGKNFLKVE
jgi:hypothetical protein